MLSERNRKCNDEIKEVQLFQRMKYMDWWNKKRQLFQRMKMWTDEIKKDNNWKGRRKNEWMNNWKGRKKEWMNEKYGLRK